MDANVFKDERSQDGRREELRLEALAGLVRGMRPFLFNEKRVPGQVMISGTGWSRVVAGEGYDWHGLRRGKVEFVLAQYTLAGEGRLRIGEVERALQPGDLMLLSLPGDNRYWLPEKSGAEWEFIYVCLRGKVAMQAWAQAASRLGACVRVGPESWSVKTLTTVVAKALRGEVNGVFSASALAYELAMAVLAEAGAAPMGEERVVVALEQARAWTEARLAEMIAVEDMARAAGMSRAHFSRLFMKQYGESPWAWLMEARVREAAHLLMSTGLSLKEVAAKCGFRDANYFGKVFSAQTGLSPGAFRKTGG